MEVTILNSCISINCPFISYCRYYDENKTFEEDYCVSAEQIAIRAKMYTKQLSEKENLENGYCA